MRLTATTTSAPAPQPPPFPLSCSSSSDPQQRAQPPPPPSSLLLAQLTTVKNARDLSSAAPHVLAPGILFRSACPAGCSERDVAVLRGALGVRTLLDLRSDEERLRDPRCLLLHSEGSEVNAFDRAGVGAAPSSSRASLLTAAAAAGADGPPSSPSSLRRSLSGLARRLLGGAGGGEGDPCSRKPLHAPTLPLGHVPADDPAPPGPGEPPLVVHRVSLLDKRRFRGALLSEMPRRRDAAAVVALGLLARATPGSLSLRLAERSRALAMDGINQGAFDFFFHFSLFFGRGNVGRREGEKKTHSSLFSPPLSLSFLRLPSSPGGLSNMYHCLLESSDAEIGASLRALLSSAERGAPALFFCRMGKDRTGLVAALVLSICGADERAILDDYVLSDDPSAEEIALGGLEKSRDLQGLETRLFARAPREAMEGALRRLREKHGSVEKYLSLRAGFTQAEQARLRAALSAGKRPTPAL